MKSISDLHFRVCDNGLFLPIAQRLARDAKRVTYWSPWEKSFPKVRDQVGNGIVERVNSPFEAMDEVDCFVFPDVGMGGIQEMLRSHELPVWGHHGGDILETDRGVFLDVLSGTDLPVPKYVKITGIDALREHLRERDDLWIKISLFRGDWETLHWRSWEEDSSLLDFKAAIFGPFREEIEFYVFDPIDSEVEDGCDAYCIEGEFPSLVVHGMEAKDKAYVGTFQRFSDLPEEVRKVNEAFGPILGEYGYRGFFSTEVRITDAGDSYFIDPTCRSGSPPSQCLTEMIGNFSEVIWAGANGELVDPEPAAKFAVQALCKFKRKPNRWSCVKLDYEMRRWVKSANCLMLGDVLYLPPDDDDNECQDWLVGIGDTFEEAIRHLKHNVGQLPDGACCDFTSLCDLLQEVQEAEKQGMEFTDQPVPDPTVVLES